MKIALIQSDIKWEDPKTNLNLLSKKIKSVTFNTQLVILPEAFSTGFTMNLTKLPELSAYPVLDWMQEMAVQTGMTIAGSTFVMENGKFFNRFHWVSPDGSYFYYDKRHLFSHAGEDRIFTPGSKRVIVEKGGFRFMLQICYDLRFPVWSANRYDKKENRYEYDALIYVANWPSKRKNAYLPLLRARAIENQAYVIWVNRVGRDIYGVKHSGDSRLIHPSGQVLQTAKSHSETKLEASLSRNELKEYRENFPLGPDWDDFIIK